MSTQKNLASLALIYLVLAVVSLRAQPAAPAAVQQMESLKRTTDQQQPLVNLQSGTNAPELYPGEDADIGPQHVLKVRPRHTMFEASVDSQYFYTANALLVHTGAKPTGVFVNTVQAAFSPGPFKLGSGKFSPTVGFLSQWYNYGLDGDNSNLGSLDFNVQKAFLAGRYQLNQNWQVYGGFEFTRLLSQQNYNEFYREYVPTIGLQRTVQMADNLIFAASLDTGYHFTEVNSVVPPTPAYINDRLDNTLSLSLSYQLVPKLVFQPFYRFQYSYYPKNTALTSHRDDFLNSFGLSVAYYFNQNVSLRAFLSREARTSDDTAVPRYWNTNLGLDLALVLRF